MSRFLLGLKEEAITVMDIGGPAVKLMLSKSLSRACPVRVSFLWSPMDAKLPTHGKITSFPFETLSSPMFPSLPSGLCHYCCYGE